MQRMEKIGISISPQQEAKGNRNSKFGCNYLAWKRSHGDSTDGQRRYDCDVHQG